ncbi:MAG: NADH-quinone oxidoreductase subunit L [Bacteroidota bacterium]|nr:NADH-quinone oxidoreductase subunit L [Candidatus Kapabacteria bacterium]MDW8075621.1 NADH-quinone oxidoreductase subunit L [Bacteroidota bacterium]MDW8272124.1 NADH-quinone oxidoreductase subunit L [Bacteroidota bacterium]
MAELLGLIVAFPLLGFVLIGLGGRRLGSERTIGAIASGAVGASFLVAVWLFAELLARPVEERVLTLRLYSWISAGDFGAEMAWRFDALSAVFVLFITGVGFLIHVYAIGYMHGDRSFPRFFAYLNLFVFMMLNLVLGDNLLVTFLGWEGVGLASYLLIGFWWDQHFEGVRIRWTGDAAMKAFVVNRIGDFGMLVAMFLLILYAGTLRYEEISSAVIAGNVIPSHVVTLIALGLFLGCTGKSAQIPLAVWLPDAMAGPTPVSALIHAATMVTSGIFLITRLNVLFAASPEAMAVVAAVGIATAFFAATIGLVQNDIKKVLAYSTVSQLGFMFTALGVGAFTAGVFHVVTHAFFKALLFLGAGSVIHALHHEQDIQRMGGLARFMPRTHWTFLVGALAIAGIFPLSGFFSKDEILLNLFVHGGPILWGIGVAAAFCTAFYMFRLYYLVFHNTERFDHHHTPHESPAVMTVPLVVLAILSAVGGLLGVPAALSGGAIPHILEQWLEPVFAASAQLLAREHAHVSHALEYTLMAASLGIAAIGIALATAFYRRPSDLPNRLADRFRWLYQVLWRKYLVDEFYYATVVDPIYRLSVQVLWRITDVAIVDGAVNGIARLVGRLGELVRRIQTGYAQSYAVLMLIGIVAVVWYLATGQ